LLIHPYHPRLSPDLLPVIAMVNPDQADELMDMLFRFQQQFYENHPAQAPGQG
jgi:hypothetical protein